MNAAEARKLAADRWRNLTHIERNQYDNVISSIRAQINKGECYEMWYSLKLNSAVVKKLREEGYHVTDSSDRDGVLIKISWGNIADENSRQ